MRTIRLQVDESPLFCYHHRNLTFLSVKSLAILRKGKGEMAQHFFGYVVIRGADNRESRKTWDMGIFDTGTDGGDFEAALSAVTQLSGALDEITDGLIVQRGVINSVQVASGNGSGDLSEQALINVWSLGTGDDPHLHKTQVYIPAPSIGIFMGPTGADRNRIDRNDIPLQQYMEQLEQHALISDGETIQLTSGIAGMESGRRVTRKIPPPGA